MKKRILSLLLLLTLAIGFALPASADTVDSVWNSDFGVLFTVTVNFHSDWGSMTISMPSRPSPAIGAATRASRFLPLI